ncbi:hypothetical protein RN001_010250 [Aquatica leii]|uniref:Peptidoglycan-recognition protein n=1 Tax=Aquatica leii TaxID=1421715 RepID=A0AAN7PUL1_9COLE|nr:hypothetical protein RN001_010250 [Aquatica leii]
MYTKSEWGGRPSLNHTRPLTHPTEYVLISHTASQFCETFATCSTKMQQMQSQHVSEFNSPDIGYNFVIGGDAGIYVGRGWDIRNFHTDRNIGISFIGNFVYDYLTVEMIEALKEVLELGVKLDKLWANYKLICHNQTSNTLSPGEHVYMEISKLPHFYDGVITI